MPAPQEFDNLRVVLCDTRNPLNMGAAARAMSNFGFRELRLVRPYAPSYEGAAAAVDAAELLKSARIYQDLAAATADCSLVVGTSAASHRQLQQSVRLLPDGGPMLAEAMRSAPAALVFGSEKRGLSNEDMSCCQWLMKIPVRSEHASMNLGQSVAVCLYELARERGAEMAPVPSNTPAARATQEQNERLNALLHEALGESGYLRQAGELERKKLRRLVLRLALSGADATLLSGMMRQMLWRMRHAASPEGE